MNMVVLDTWGIKITRAIKVCWCSAMDWTGFLGFWMSGFQSGNQVFFPQILGSHGVTMKLSFNSRIAEKAIQRHPDTERHHNLSVSHSTAIYCFILAIISGAWLWGLWNFSRWMLVLYRSKKRQPAEHLAPCHLFRWTPPWPPQNNTESTNKSNQMRIWHKSAGSVLGGLLLLVIDGDDVKRTQKQWLLMHSETKWASQWCFILTLYYLRTTKCQTSIN